MSDPMLDYTKDNLRKHVILTEDHMRQFPCPDCVNKHLLAAEGYAEEGVSMAENPEEENSFMEIAGVMRNARKKFNDEVGMA
jgi:hypothetical protein